MAVVKLVGAREAPKSKRSSMETLLVSQAQVASWQNPPFQRPMNVNAKVRALVEELKNYGGIIPGVITLGILPGEKGTPYIVDGQHRLEAFKISGLIECIVDVRMCDFDSMADMAEEFVRLNSRLVNLKSDDILKGMEGKIKALAIIRSQCPFVGYSQIRRGNAQSGPVIGMSQVLRCWSGSEGEVPGGGSAGAAKLAEDMDQGDAEQLTKFLLYAAGAWGRDPEYYRLWGTLNLTMCMWMWRRLVIDQARGVKRAIRLTPDQFKRCLMAVSSSADYLDWLTGRAMCDRDRSPCYRRLCAIFSSRIKQEQGDKKPLFPSPSWYSGRS